MSDGGFGILPVDPFDRAVQLHLVSTGHEVCVEEEHWEGEMRAWCRECDWKISDKIHKSPQDAP